jgi:hypothetical protein
LNPLAVELGAFKATLNPGDRKSWLDGATRIVEIAEQRRHARSGPTQKYGPEELALFDIHVLLELDSLSSEISKIEARGTRRALALCVSAILTKVSRRAGDSSYYRGQKRIAGGFTSELFARKVEELSGRADEYAALLPKPAHSARVFESDARKLDEIRDASIDLAVTSPPYPGVFDYLDHHADRMRWLGLSPRGLKRSEIGARRVLEPLGYEAGVEHWRRELAATLRELSKKLKPGGAVAMVLADSVIAGSATYADDIVSQVASRSGFELELVLSQRRPHFHRPTAQAFRGRPRHEHLFLLRRA